ncbi:MAG TPA: sugar-transfer associated ATP-grasp domain-containing protein, partial [Burkholderiales bacterium]|nr:sugar-transfer associated ATP-grasp domain-containing protein [Burkholderiales bacterium]
REYRRVIDALNPGQYRKLSQNKIAEKAILSLLSVPTPKFVGRLNAQDGVTRSGDPLNTAHDLQALIARNGYQRLVFKELEGHGGKGVRIASFEADDGWWALPVGTSKRISLDNYCSSELRLNADGDWLVEEYFSQHSTIASLNPNSVNTVRIWIKRNVTGARVLTAYLRIGRAAMFVDNASSGGIVAPIDVKTGKLGPAQDAHAARGLYPLHPDHGARIDGVSIPFWPQVQALAVRALCTFPQINFAGLDIAVGETGPVVLELNVSPDREGAGFTGYRSIELLSR